MCATGTAVPLVQFLGTLNAVMLLLIASGLWGAQLLLELNRHDPGCTPAHLPLEAVADTVSRHLSTQGHTHNRQTTYNVHIQSTSITSHVPTPLHVPW